MVEPSVITGIVIVAGEAGLRADGDRRPDKAHQGPLPDATGAGRPAGMAA